MKSIFISYSDKDRNKMRSLERLINNYKLILSPTIISDNRQALILLSTKVITGITDCDYFIPILTRSSINTQWINQEIGFATALKKATLPIVEHSVTGKLRGFIHKQLDLSYSFKGDRNNNSTETSKFRLTAKILLNDILFENKESPKNISIEDLFPGKWESTYILNYLENKEHEIEIREKKKYFVQGTHLFNLEDIKIDVRNKTIKFNKVGLNDSTKIYNELNIIEFGRRYEGTENNSVQGADISIVYNRIS